MLSDAIIALVQFEREWVHILDPFDEARYAWVTTNYLQGNLVCQPPAHPPACAHVCGVVLPGVAQNAPSRVCAHFCAHLRVPCRAVPCRAVPCRAVMCRAVRVA